MRRLLLLVAVAFLISPTSGRTDPHGVGIHNADTPYSAGRAPLVSIKGAGRPSGCPRAWCGCYLGIKMGLRDRSLWLARNWAKLGRAVAGPAPGVVAVFARGRRGGHVGIVTAVPGPGRIVLHSGNDGNAVRERERSTKGVIAWRAL